MTRHAPTVVGFTGTRSGMTAKQLRTCDQVLRALFERSCGLDQFHHGDCVGADAEAHGLVVGGGLGLVQVHIHPPNNNAARARCTANCVCIYAPKPYLERNKNIVDACLILVACPEGPEVVRSGTWSTVRYARKRKRYVVTVWPDGGFTEEG